MTLTGKQAGGSLALAKALGAVAEGQTFYELAHRVAADTRVKVTFEDLARRKGAELSKIEAVAGPTAKDAAPRPAIFPLEFVSKAECYVCGHVVETRSLPDQCPNCGTARYTFEKEISLVKAWEIAGEAARRSATLFRECAAQGDDGAKPLLEELTRAEDDLAKEAREELAELRG